tara:strand:+ start:244 stop:1098 length:855 start_codon:yes stop_codon:yes gene_type:complete
MHMGIESETGGMGVTVTTPKAPAPKATAKKKAAAKMKFIFSLYAPPPLVSLIRNQPALRLGRTLVELNFGMRFDKDFVFNIDTVDAFFSDEANWPPLLRTKFTDMRNSMGRIDTYGQPTPEGDVYARTMFAHVWKGIQAKGFGGAATLSGSSRVRPLTGRRLPSVIICEDSSITYNPNSHTVSGTTGMKAARPVTEYQIYSLATELEWEIDADAFLDMDAEELSVVLGDQAHDLDSDYWEHLETDTHDSSWDSIEEVGIRQGESVELDTAIANLREHLNIDEDE